MLDADSLPLRDPKYLLSSPHLLQHGAMFYTDFWSLGLSTVPLIANSTAYGLVGIKEEPYWVRDCHKTQCEAAVHVADIMCGTAGRGVTAGVTPLQRLHTLCS